MKFFTILLLLAASGANAIAQDSGERLRTLVGMNAPGGKAYLLWQSPDATLLSGKRYAIFSKSGAAGAAGAYSLQGINKLTLRSVDIATILADNPQLFDEAALVEAIDALFDIALPRAMPLNQKLSALMLIVDRDAEAFEQMILLARVHPVIALCLGTAAALPLEGGGVTTFELRSLPGNDLSRAGDSVDVAGRVTVDPAALVVLPAPLAPTEVRLDGPKSHLAIRMRWDIGDNLRALSVFQHGYNVYRIERNFAELHDYQNTPPTAKVLDDSPIKFKRINALPILPPEDAEQGNYFVHDDNDHFEENGVPFDEGDQFYYFVTARDVFGRSGATSQGTLMTAIGRRRPAPPVGVEVVNYFERTQAGVDKQNLKVSWFTPLRGQIPDSYQLFRWDSVGAMQAALADQDNPPVPIKEIGHVADQFEYCYVDGFNTVQGRTYWYSVMSVWTNSANEELLSANSMMAWGVLRDRQGPEPAHGAERVITSERLTVSHTATNKLLPDDPSEPNPIELCFVPNDDAITWARFIHINKPINGTEIPDDFEAPANPASPLPLDWTLIGDANMALAEIKVTYRQPDKVRQGLLVCIAGTANGRRAMAAANYGDFGTPQGHNSWRVDFAANYQIVTQAVPADDPAQNPHLVNLDGSLLPIVYNHSASVSARSFKYYRRVDDGPKTLVHQGVYTKDEREGITKTSYSEVDLPAHASRICHYLQTFDEHGNPSAMQCLGCSTTTSRVPLPQPLLTPLIAGGDTANPTASLVWVCDPYGIERFRILVAESTAGEPTITSPLWTPDPLAGLGQMDFFRYYSFLTPRTAEIGADGRFELPLKVVLGKTHIFRVIAISPAGDESIPSDPVSFAWRQSQVAPGPIVAWPVRGEGEVQQLGSGSLAAPRYIDNAESEFEGVVVRIGQAFLASHTGFTPGKLDAAGRTPTLLYGPKKPAYTYLSDLSGEIEVVLDPDDTTTDAKVPRSFVLYRIQVANDRYPADQLSGQLVQVTPLIDRIRSRAMDNARNDIPPEGPGQQQGLRIYDPFIEAIRESDLSSVVQFVVKDTQGVVYGARYRYQMVRFYANGEIAGITNLGEVTAAP